MPDHDELRRFVVGDLETNCYAYVSQGECLVVDPGASGARIARALDDVRVRQVVATHRHHDHVCGVRELVGATGAPWGIGATDALRVTEALELSSHVLDVRGSELSDPPVSDMLLRDGDTLRVGTAAFLVVDAPGHTEGGIVLVGRGSAEGIAFVGDTLFAGSCGRCDLLGGDWDAMAATLGRLLLAMAPETVLLCGHGPQTTMAEELRTNPYLRRDPRGPSHGGA